MNLRFPMLAIMVYGCLSSRCTRSTDTEALEASEESLYAGSMACRNCHEGVFNSQQLTPHHLTSQLPDSASIKGSFEEGKNIFFYSPGRFGGMEKKDNDFFKT